MLSFLIVLAIIMAIVNGFFFKKYVVYVTSKIDSKLFSRTKELITTNRSFNQYSETKKIKKILINEGYSEKEIANAISALMLSKNTNNYFSTPLGGVFFALLLINSYFLRNIEIMTWGQLIYYLINAILAVILVILFLSYRFKAKSDSAL